MVINGFTGVEDVFSGERNFYDAYGVNPIRGALGEALGSRYEIMRTSIKRWTVGSPIQAPLDSLDTLMQESNLSTQIDQIRRVNILIPHESLSIVNNREMPEICLQHLVALMLLEGQMSFELAHDRSRMLDPQVLSLRALVNLQGSDELSKFMPTRQGIAEVEFKSGQVFRAYTRDVKGTPDNPMTRQELDRKCVQLMTPVLGKERSIEVCEVVWNLDQLDKAKHLTRLLELP
jgi:2-methylcitrate dehydratase PrpD